MADQSFVHDESSFNPAQSPSGIELSDTEAKYAELFTEVIWDGIITPDEREQLNTAAKVFGLSTERIQKIEQALTASYEARHQIHIVDGSQDPGGAAVDERTLAPLAASVDPRLQALQRRIAVVEKRNEELRHRNAELKDARSKLEESVARLQLALEQTMRELSNARSRASSRGLGPAARPSESENLEAHVFDVPDTDAEPAQGSGPPLPTLPADLEAELRVSRTMRDSVLPGTEMARYSEAAAAAAAAKVARGDPAEIHRLLRQSPRDVELLRALFRSLQRGDDLDRRWCITHVLCYLGQANAEERDIHDKHASNVVVRPARAVNKDEWTELLMHPDEDRLTGEIFADVAPAVLLGQLSALRREAVPETPYPTQEVDPRTSGLEVVRCMVWSAAFLGLKVPPMSVAPEDPGIVELVLSPKPASRIGKQALVGRSSKELAFLAGRHLSWYRGEHIVGKLAGSTRHLEDIFLAALMIGNPGLPATDEIKQRVEPIARTIAPLLDALAVDKLRGYFARFVEQGGRTNLHKWRRAADRTAACTGLLLANDLHAAEAILKLEDESQLSERMDELIVYFAAGRCSLLRKRIGIAITAA